MASGSYSCMLPYKKDSCESAAASVLSVLGAGIRIRTSYACIALFLFLVYVSDGEEQYRRYYYNCCYCSKIHRTVPPFTFHFSIMHGE